ncbi:MAG: PHP domain-containing protein [Oscillospiraceae bacterium]
MAGDLHTHTNFSDGSSDIELLPFLAQRAALSHLAVSDHDTAKCIQYALDNKKVNGVELVPAVELTAFDEKRARRVHILCYYPELTTEICKFFDIMADRRNEACDKIIEQLCCIYPQFTREKAKEYALRSGVTFKTHLIKLLFEYGYTDGIYKELYKELFGSKCGKVLHDPAYENVQTVLGIAQRAHGVIVLAHPSVYDSMQLAKELAEEGQIDGIEINHPKNTSKDKEELSALANKYNLIITGGSDFHGSNMSLPTPIGGFVTDCDNISRIKELAYTKKCTK